MINLDYVFSYKLICCYKIERKLIIDESATFSSNRTLIQIIKKIDSKRILTEFEETVMLIIKDFKDFLDCCYLL